MHKTTLRIRGDTSRFVYRDDTAAIMSRIGSESETFRASHVEPCGNQWTADMGPVDGPVLGPFNTRESALKAELSWIQENMGL